MLSCSRFITVNAIKLLKNSLVYILISFVKMTGNVNGGCVSYSNNDDGVYASERNGRYNYGFTPPHNSCYMFFGSYTHHAVSRVIEGTRLAFVFFYQPHIRFHELIFKFGRQPEQCPCCFGLFENRQYLRFHVQNVCEGRVLFNRFKEKGYRFNPEKEL